MNWFGACALVVFVLGMGGCILAYDYDEHELQSSSSTAGGGGAGGEITSSASSSGDTNPNLTPCKAQRLVHIVGGDGGLAWFTQVWPVPENVKSFSASVALDHPASFGAVTVPGGHELFARLRPPGGTVPLWSQRGAAPHPTVFLAGANETHTPTPISAVVSPNNNNGLVPAAAVLQNSLAPRVPAVLLVYTGPYGSAPGAPQAMLTADFEPAISALQSGGTINAVEATMLRPSASQLASYFDANAPPSVTELGTRLAFTANAFKLGVFGSVVMPAFNDDPHTAFADATTVPARADQLARVLDAFYLDLAGAHELGCGDDTGNFLSLADNTVMMVTGDTYKNPFTNVGWPDDTPMGTNLMYLRSNGYIKPGWFGTLTPTTTSFFDPATGAAGGTQAADTQAAWSAALYAVSRGNLMAIADFTGSEFSGTVLK